MRFFKGKMNKDKHKNKNNEAKKRGNPSRELLYAEAAKHALRAIDILVKIMETGDNDNARMAAAKVILAKAIPDLHFQELAGVNKEPIQIRIVEDFVSSGGWSSTKKEQVNTNEKPDTQSKYIFGEKQV